MITEKDLIPTYEFKGKEKDLEQHFLDNIYDISKMCGWGDIIRFENQFRINFGKNCIILDVMIWHKDGTGTCIEIKTGKHNRNDLLTGVSQLLSYGYKTKFSLGKRPRLVLITPQIEREVNGVIKEYNLPIDMLMIDADRCVYLPCQNLTNESIR